MYFSFNTFSVCALWRFFNWLLICCLVSWKNSLCITDRNLCVIYVANISPTLSFSLMFYFFLCSFNFYSAKSIILIFSHFLLLCYKSCFQPKLHKLITLIKCDKQYSRMIRPIPTVWRHTKNSQLKWAEGAELIHLFLLCYVS